MISTDMKHLYNFLLLSIALSLALSAQSQSPLMKIIGSIKDADSGSALEFATISLYSLPDSTLLGGTLTDDRGHFVLESTNQADYALIEFIGYAATYIDLRDYEWNSRNIDLGEIKVSSSGFQLEGIDIVAERSETSFGLDKRIFTVGKDLANRGGSAEDILDNVPSVTVDVEGGVSLRGSEGVRILINGQRTGLGENLKSIPSNQIDRIEVITNPSARYDAEGVAGIINIILKQARTQGFNGSIDANVGHPLSAGIGANLNYRRDKFNWFAGYAGQYRSNLGGGWQRIERPIQDTLLVTDQQSDRDRSGLNHTLRFGADYFFNEKTTLTGSFRYQQGEDDNLTKNVYNDAYYLGNLPSADKVFRQDKTFRTDDEVEKENELEYSLLFNKEFSSREHNLNVILDYQDEIESESSDFIEQINYGDSSIETILQRSNNDEKQKQWTLQADYVHPFGENHRMEWGIKGSIREITNNFLVEQNFDDVWQALDNLSNDFEYNEDIYAAYGQYGDHFGKFSYQIGLRAEYSDILTELKQTDERNQRDYINLFPSVFTSYQFSLAHAVQLSYSRRINRPRFWDLNPFFTFSDSRNFFSGNPNLNPEYSDSYDLNYLWIGEKATFNTGVFYRRTDGVVERIRTIDEQGRTHLRPENLSKRDDYGLELSINYNGSKWLKLDASANFFRSITNGRNFDQSFYNDTYTWFSRLTSRFNFWESDLQLRMNYRAPRETVQGKDKSMTSIDIGWSKDLLPKKNLTITFSIRDLLNARKRRYEQYGDGFYTEGEHQWRQRSFNLAFNYRINQKKQREKNRTGGGDEMGGGEEF